MENGTELFEDYAQAYQNLVQVCEEKNVTRDLPTIKAEFAQSNNSWRDTRVKVPNDTWNVETVESELERYEQKYSQVIAIVATTEEVLSGEPSYGTDVKIALSEWQKLKVGGTWCC